MAEHDNLKLRFKSSCIFEVDFNLSRISGPVISFPLARVNRTGNRLENRSLALVQAGFSTISVQSCLSIPVRGPAFCRLK